MYCFLLLSKNQKLPRLMRTLCFTCSLKNVYQKRESSHMGLISEYPIERDRQDIDNPVMPLYKPPRSIPISNSDGSDVQLIPSRISE